VRANIEAGLADSAANRVTPVEELLKELGISDVDSLERLRRINEKTPLS
jgi:hypothetical protein